MVDKCFLLSSAPPTPHLHPTPRSISYRSAVCPDGIPILVLHGGQLENVYLYWLCLLLFLSSSPALLLPGIITPSKLPARKALSEALLLGNLG